MSSKAEPNTSTERRYPPAADLFAFDEAAPARQARIRRVVPVAPIQPREVLELVGQVRWPGAPAIARALAAALAESGITIQKEPDGDGPDRWHPVPYQGIDGQVGQFDLLVGTVDFLEDAGIPVAESIRPALTECDQRGWWPVLVGASHRRQGPQPAHRSLIGLLAIDPRPSEDLPARSPQEGPAGHGSSAPAGTVQIVTMVCHRLRASVAGLRFRRCWPVAALALASALAGLWCSALTVRADELAAIQRFGRLVAVCGPGLHFRPCWPLEHVTRLQVGPERTCELTFPASAGADPNDAPIADLLPTGDLWPPDNPADQAALGLTDPGPAHSASQLLQARARINYSIADPTAFLFAVRDPDSLVRTAAESVLRTLVAGRSMAACLGPARADVAARAGRLLQERMDQLGCGIAVDAFVVDELEPSNRSDILQTVHAELDRIGHGIQTLAEADRRIAEARRQAMNVVAAARKDSDRQIDSAQSLLERVQTHHDAFVRDPQATRQQLLVDFLGKSPAALQALRELLQAHTAGRHRPEPQKGGPP